MLPVPTVHFIFLVWIFFWFILFSFYGWGLTLFLERLDWRKVTAFLFSKWTNLGIWFWPVPSPTDLHCKSYLNWWSYFSLGRCLVLWNQMLQSIEPSSTELIPELSTLLLTTARNPRSVQTFGNDNLWIRAALRTEGSPCPAVPGGYICFMWHLIFRCYCVDHFMHSNGVSNSRKPLECASWILFILNILWGELSEVFLLRVEMLTNTAHMHRKIICTWYKERVEIIFFGSC